MIAQVAIVAATGALALDAHEDGLSGVLVEELVDAVDHLAEVLDTGQTDGEGAVDESQLVIVQVDGDTDVEEADAVAELLGDADGLAANRGQGGMTGRRVVSARNGEDGEGPLVVKLGHPGIEVRRGEDGDEGGLGNVDGSEVVLGVGVDLLHDGAAA